MKIVIVQSNPKIGDLDGNYQAAVLEVEKARKANADLIVFPELATIGYPPKDLLEKPAFIKETMYYTEKWATLSRGIAILFGTVAERDPYCIGKRLENVACLAFDGLIQEKHPKKLLPTYDVFDEDRYFKSAESVWSMSLPLKKEGKTVKLGAVICEDSWSCKTYWKKPSYPDDPLEHLKDADVIINISASPFHIGKPAVREDMFSYIAEHMNKPLVYCNQVGGNDDVVYDGNSMVFNRNGDLCEQLAGFREDSRLIDLDDLKPKVVVSQQIVLQDNDDVFSALVLGVRDYARKTGFKKAVIGLSGGIDSSVVAVIAAEALGPENVLGVGMPSKYSSDGSVNDARSLAKNLGMGFEIIPIKDPHRAYMNLLAERMGGMNEAKTELWEENLQARSRGTILMAISNKENRLLLTTGNKSEISMGYFTLYGDSCGGLAVIADLFKTRVYSLAKWINAGPHYEGMPEKRGKYGVPPIPVACIEKPPSAELRPNQKDEDSLPPYSRLDAMLGAYVEEAMSAEEIAKALDENLAAVQSIIAKVDKCEYKRKQLPPGLKVTRKAFGTGRQMPIAQGWYK